MHPWQRAERRRQQLPPGSLCFYTVPEMDHMLLLARGFTLEPCVGGFYFILLPLNFWPLPPAPACCVVHFRPFPGCVRPLPPPPANILNIHSRTIVPLILWLPPSRLGKTQCLILMKNIHTIPEIEFYVGTFAHFTPNIQSFNWFTAKAKSKSTCCNNSVTANTYNTYDKLTL